MKLKKPQPKLHVDVNQGVRESKEAISGIFHVLYKENLQKSSG